MKVNIRVLSVDSKAPVEGVSSGLAGGDDNQVGLTVVPVKSGAVLSRL